MIGFVVQGHMCDNYVCRSFDLKSYSVVCIWIQRERKPCVMGYLVKTQFNHHQHTISLKAEGWLQYQEDTKPHFLHTITVIFEARLYFSAGAQITLLTSGMHLYLTAVWDSLKLWWAAAVIQHTPLGVVTHTKILVGKTWRCAAIHTGITWTAFSIRRMSTPLPFPEKWLGKKKHQACGGKANAFSMVLDLCSTSALNYATHTLHLNVRRATVWRGRA